MRFAVFVLSLILLGPATAKSQVRAARQLDTTSMLDYSPLSSVAHLVELVDGRVLVYDSTEKELGVVDFRTAEFRAVAVRGAGPLEFGDVGTLLRLAGDSILLWDPANARRLILSPGGLPASSRSAWEATQRGNGLARFVPREVDRRGVLLGTVLDFMAGRTHLVRVGVAGAPIDTLATFATALVTPRRTAEGIVKVVAPGFPPVDAWGAFPDGRVLIVHGDTYTPEIVRPDGSRTRVTPIPYARIRVTAADRAAHLAASVKRMEWMLGRESGGRGPIPKVEAEAPDPRPVEHPPIQSPDVRVDSRQRAWVRVIDGERDTGDRYDLLNADGRLVDVVRLPKGRTLVGMGSGVLYATRVDADGFHYLERYDLP